MSSSAICEPNRLSHVGRIFPALRRLLLSVFLSCCCYSVSLHAQASNPNQSWTDTSVAQSDNANPTRTVEKHTQSGNRTIDSQSIERRDADGNFEPYQDIEKTTIQVDSSTVRTVTRTFGRDSDGAKTLVQVTEEETHTRPGGDSSVVRSTSNPDANGNLQLVQREISETKITGKDSEETKTTVMLPSANGGLAPAMMVEERKKQDSDDTVQSKKTTLLPDVNGNWQVSEVQQATTRKNGSEVTTDKQTSHADIDGHLSETSRMVSKASETPGAKHDSVETYSLDVPGAAPDGNLHMVERTVTTQSTNSNGAQNTERRVERLDPGDLDAGLQTAIVSTDTVRPGSSGAQAVQTIQMRDANGSMGIVSIDTAKSNSVNAVQVQISPATPSKTAAPKK